MKSLNEIIGISLCRIIDHDWRYNFHTLPNKSICKRCKKKQILDLRLLQWKDVLSFDKETRTDKELINKWFK